MSNFFVFVTPFALYALWIWFDAATDFDRQARRRIAQGMSAAGRAALASPASGEDAP